MGKYSKYYYNTRYIMPLMIGVIVGFAFSLLCTPLYDCDNKFTFELFSSSNQSKLNLVRLRRNMRARSAHEQLQLDILDKQHQKQIDEFEPRINLQGKPKKPQKAVQKLIRPRYISTELNIRYKLFVGIISTSRVLSNLAPFLNETISPYANKVTFFVNNAEMNEKLLLESTPPGLSVVNFNDDRDNLLPFHSFKYVIDNYLHNYNWFFFVTDNTFVRASQLSEFLNHLSISQNLYMGYSRNDKHSIYCSLSAGIIFSNTLLGKIQTEMEWCTKNSYSDDSTENIGRCILHSTNLACAQTANGREIKLFTDSSLNIRNNLSQIVKSKEFNESITFNPVENLETMKMLKLYFDELEMNEILEGIARIEENILETVCETPEGCDSLVWPLGVPPPYKPINRHEVIRWDYFNETHVFLANDFEVASLMSENFEQDVKEVVEFCMENINKKYNNQFELKKILNGYKQFDPTRGSSYVLDLLLSNKQNNIDTHHKRLNVMRPLGHLEIIPMPYVTENSKITLVLIVSSDHGFDEILSFFESYENFILKVKEAAEKLNLHIIYFSTGDDNQSYLGDRLLFARVKENIKELSKKYSSLISTSSRILQDEIRITNLTSYLSRSQRQLITAEYLSKRLPSEALVFISSPCVEFQSEFLNRIRLNTIKNHQVFFPIAFSQYMPNIVHAEKPFPRQVEINKNVGFFNYHNFDFVSFYNMDFIESRKTASSKLQEINSWQQVQSIFKDATDLYDLFTKKSSLNVLRSTDQAFKCRWHLLDQCEKENSEEQMKRCLSEREKSFGTKAHLAMHLMNNFESIFNS